MPRTQSNGIKFFSFDVDFFSDPKVKILKARYGTDGIAIYLYCLCLIYREGYYVKVDHDLYYVISDELRISTETVEQVMTFLLKRSMLNEQLFKSDAVLTGAGIQDRWQKAVKTRAQKTPIIVSDYWLLSERETEPFIKCTLFEDSSGKNENNSEKNDDNSENYDHKVNKSKIDKSKAEVEHTYTDNIINNSGGGDLRARIEGMVLAIWCRKPTEKEVKDLIALSGFMDDWEDILAEALRLSAESAKANISYVRGIYNNLMKRGIRTIEEFWNFEAERELRKDSKRNGLHRM